MTESHSQSTHRAAVAAAVKSIPNIYSRHGYAVMSSRLSIAACYLSFMNPVHRISARRDMQVNT